MLKLAEEEIRRGIAAGDERTRLAHEVSEKGLTAGRKMTL